MLSLLGDFPGVKIDIREWILTDRHCDVCFKENASQTSKRYKTQSIVSHYVKVSVNATDTLPALFIFAIIFSRTMNKQDDEITPLPPTYEKSNELVQNLESAESTTGSVDRPTEPSDEDLATLRRVSETIPLRAWYIFRT